LLTAHFVIMDRNYLDVTIQVNQLS